MDYNMPAGDSQIKLEYDNRLRVSHASTTLAGSTTSYLMKADFDYLADGRVAAKDDLLDNKWDQVSKYDFAGRLSFNQFGLSGSIRVYQQSVSYDAFSQMTDRGTIYWDTYGSFEAEYTNGRKNYWAGYDAAGNVISQTELDHNNWQWATFDAAGRRTVFRDRWRVSSSAKQENETQFVFDGDGRPVIEKHGSRTIMSSEPDPMTVSVRSYQVWSSVLGASLTTVDTDGDKKETKVFAGGTLIARQNANGTASTGDDNIAFMTADPVTGTKATFAGGGSTTHIEQTEPLGQKIELTDPASAYPTNYENVLGIAREPEWQCMLPQEIYGGFMGMPIHCMKAAIEDRNFSLAGAFGYFREEDPKKISLVDPPMPVIPGEGGGGGSPSALVLARSTRSTYKRSKERKDDPHDGGQLATVQSQPWIDPTDAISAENGIQEKPRPLREDEVRDLTHNFLIFINDSDCANFIQDLLNTAQEIAEANGQSSRMWSDDIRGMFDTVASQGGFTYGDTILNSVYKVDGSTVKGSFQNEDAGVEFSTTYTQRVKPGGLITKKTADGRNRQQAITMVSTAIHEILHLAGFSDNQLAHAAAEILKDPTFRGTPIPLRPRTRTDVTNASYYWSNRLGEQCGTTRRDWSGIRVLR